MNSPCPILLRECVLGGECPGNSATNLHGAKQCVIQSEDLGTVEGIAGVFDRDLVSRIVLAVAEARHAKHPVAVGASRVSTEGYSEQLQRVLLLIKVEPFDPPKRLVLAGRSRKDCARNGHGIRRSQGGNSLLTIYVDIYIKVANLCDAFLGPLPNTGKQWIGGNIDVRAVVILIAQPSKIAWRNSLLQPDDPLCRRRRVLLTEENSNRFSGAETAG